MHLQNIIPSLFPLFARYTGKSTSPFVTGGILCTRRAARGHLYVSPFFAGCIVGKPGQLGDGRRSSVCQQGAFNKVNITSGNIVNGGKRRTINSEEIETVYRKYCLYVIFFSFFLGGCQNDNSEVE